MSKTSLATSEPTSIAQPDDTQRLMAIAIEQGEAGVAALERLVAMRERAEDRAAERAFAAAMRAAQSEIQPVAKNRKNEQTRSEYADLLALHDEIVPIYTRHGFSLSYDEGDSPRGEGWVRIECDVMHEAGHTKHKHMDLPLDDRGIAGKTNKTALHAIGSTVSYGRRYIALMIFNVATRDDNDGNRRREADVTPVTPEQAADLKSLLDELPEARRAGALAWAGSLAGIEDMADFSQLPARLHRQVASKLEAARNA